MMTVSLIDSTGKVELVDNVSLPMGCAKIICVNATRIKTSNRSISSLRTILMKTLPSILRICFMQLLWSNYMVVKQKKIMNDDYVVALSNAFHLYRKKFKQTPSIQG
jgi:hypothetical protein